MNVLWAERKTTSFNLWAEAQNDKFFYKPAPRAWDVARPGPKLSSHTWNDAALGRVGSRAHPSFVKRSLAATEIHPCAEATRRRFW